MIQKAELVGFDKKHAFYVDHFSILDHPEDPFCILPNAAILFPPF
jgi:hypothetical protein